MASLTRVRVAATARSPLTLRSTAPRFATSTNPLRHPIKDPLQSEMRGGRLSNNGLYVWSSVGLGIGGMFLWLLAGQKQGGKVSEAMPESIMPKDRFAQPHNTPGLDGSKERK
ncbi:hypothetical protein G7046_g4053 [Stylonectria norvegica]|nr:hypothetical protein G7046_g4053 [Stylonectria norvegica]